MTWTVTAFNKNWSSEHAEQRTVSWVVDADAALTALEAAARQGRAQSVAAEESPEQRVIAAARRLVATAHHGTASLHHGIGCFAKSSVCTELGDAIAALDLRLSGGTPTGRGEGLQSRDSG